MRWLGIRPESSRKRPPSAAMGAFGVGAPAQAPGLLFRPAAAALWLRASDLRLEPAMRRLLALILLTLLLEACGNKGPLFLPAEDGKPRRTESSPGVRIPPQAP